MSIRSTAHYKWQWDFVYSIKPLKIYVLTLYKYLCIFHLFYAECSMLLSLLSIIFFSFFFSVLFSLCCFVVHAFTFSAPPNRHFPFFLFHSSLKCSGSVSVYDFLFFKTLHHSFHGRFFYRVFQWKPRQPGSSSFFLFLVHIMCVFYLLVSFLFGKYLVIRSSHIFYISAMDTNI